MPPVLQLYLASEDEAEAIAAGEYTAPQGSSLTLPGNLDADDLAALNCLLAGCRLDPDLSVVDDELLADGTDAAVYRALPEFVERLSALVGRDCRAEATRWAEFLSEREDGDGWWTEAKAQRLLQRLATFARRARIRDLPMLLSRRRR
jgi:hypothetical protein